MSWLKKIVGFLKRLFSPETASAIERGIEVVLPYLNYALDIVRTIAALTPTRVDDEILAVIERYTAPFTLPLPAGQTKGELLHKIALEELRRIFPNATDRALNRAIEIAYGAVNP